MPSDEVQDTGCAGVHGLAMSWGAVLVTPAMLL